MIFIDYCSENCGFICIFFFSVIKFLFIKNINVIEVCYIDFLEVRYF